MGFYSAVIKSEVMKFVGQWTDLKSIPLIEMSLNQNEKNLSSKMQIFACNAYMFIMCTNADSIFKNLQRKPRVGNKRC